MPSLLGYVDHCPTIVPLDFWLFHKTLIFYGNLDHRNLRVVSHLPAIVISYWIITQKAFMNLISLYHNYCTLSVLIYDRGRR